MRILIFDYFYIIGKLNFIGGDIVNIKVYMCDFNFFFVLILYIFNVKWKWECLCFLLIEFKVYLLCVY